MTCGVKQPAKERLLLGSAVDPSTGCRVWQKSKGRTGYARIQVNYKHESAHRIAYTEFIGPIPLGMCVLHRCDNRACIEPAHLFLGTHTDNMRDAGAKGRNWTQNPAHVDKLRSLNRKLTAAQVIEIRRRHAGGEQSFHALAGAFDISEAQVRRIVRGQRWGWLAQPAPPT